MYEVELLKSKNCDEIYEVIEKSLRKLLIYFSFEVTDEFKKALIFEKLYNSITLKKHLKVNEPLIIIAEVYLYF